MVDIGKYDKITKMKNIKNKKIISLLILGLILNPLALALAQEASGSTDIATSSVDTESIIATDTSDQQMVVSLVTDATSTDIQQTANTQETIEGGLLESTVNPNTDIASTTATSTLILESPVDTTDSTSSVISTDTTSSDSQITDIENPIDTTVVSTSTDTLNQDAAIQDDTVAHYSASDQDLLQEQEKERVAQYNKKNSNILATFGANALRPQTKFSFNVRPQKIASKRMKKGTVDQSITQVDTNTGIISVSGVCNNTYYVILLYKNQNDYTDNPGSYIINKAYDCVSHAYSYAISDLPNNLANGTYYLLVAEMGDSGGWTPITGLTPVDINKN